MKKTMTPRENQSVEWKESWRDEYLKWIAAFANSDGGVLEIGRNDKGEVIGVTNIKDLLEIIPNKVRDILGIIVKINIKKTKPYESLLIIVDEYPYPVSYKGQYFVRSGSTTQELKGAALDRFLLKKQGNHWDDVPVPRVSISDLDTKVIQRFRERAVKSQRLSEKLVADDDKTLIDKLKLVENSYLKRAALLLFHPDPERFITGAFIKIGFFETNADLLFQNNIHGDLFTQVTQTMDFLLTKYLKAYISYEGVQRIETFPVPEAALREAVLNAITHKDYSNSSPIQISVYRDKLMIWNPGVLPNKWTIEKLLSKHASQPYNPKVANVFFLAGMIESWGRGIEKIIEACATAGSPTPEFKDDGTGLWTTFFFDSKVEIGDNMGDRIGNNVGDIIGDRIGSNIGDSNSVLFPSKLNKTQQEILSFMKRNPNISTSDIAVQIGISKRNIEVNIAKLKELGLLTRIGPAKGGHWKVLEK